MDLNETPRHHEAAKGDSNALALAAIDVVLASLEPALTSALEAAAVPHWFDEPLLRTLLNEAIPDADDWFDQLVSMTVVERFHAHKAWTVHEVTRQALRNRLAEEQPDRFRALSKLAASLLEGHESSHVIERVYHLLTSELGASEEAATELRELWKDWTRAGRYEALQALGIALEELIRTDLLTPQARAQALLCFGWIREGRLPLPEAEQIAREALELMSATGNQLGQAEGHQQLGDVFRDRGHRADALREYRACHAIMLALTERDPENTDWQHDLSVTHKCLGGVFEAQGRLGGALAEYEAGKAIAIALTERDPENMDWQRGLSVDHRRLGGVFEAQGRLGDALIEYDAAKAINHKALPGKTLDE